MTCRTSLLALAFASCLAGCGKPASTTKSPPPAKAEAVAHESDLLKLTLTDEAQKRLGLTTIRVGAGSAAVTRETSGEIVVPAGVGGVPTNSVSNLQQLGV